MPRSTFVFVFAGTLVVAVAPVGAQVRRLAELNTDQIRALDRAKTVVFLPRGILEEHGPYLPSFTDGILGDRLTDEFARAVERQKPGWTALVLPKTPLGASGSNELGSRFVFPGTCAVRPSTLRSIFTDLADELGQQDFRWLIVVHVHDLEVVCRRCLAGHVRGVGWRGPGPVSTVCRATGPQSSISRLD